MAKKKIELKRDTLDTILNSIKSCPDYSNIVDGDEGQIDVAVTNYLKDVCGYDDIVIKGHNTGNRQIDDNFPSPKGIGSGNGHPDITIYNLYGKNEISIIIENKAKKASDTKEETINQAIAYTANPKLPKPCRVVIGNHPDYNVEIRVLVNGKYKPLIVNRNQVEGFIGKDLLDIVYNNPNINEFVFSELIVKPFTQKDFHRIIDNLKTLYRQSPEIQNTDETSINFTIAFIALKMIAVKVGQSWQVLSSVDEILSFLDSVVGDKATDANMREKYSDIFKMYDKDGKKIVFDFKELLESVDAREKDDHRINGVIDTNYTSVIMQIHKMISDIPDEDIPIDLFGEVYESLASNKTKAVLGQYFTRRHIIKAIVRMFFSEDDIEDIVDNKKTIADCCCGTGGFLTESFKYIKDYYERKNGTTEDISNLASEIIVGYDIDANSIGRTRVNMTLAGDGFSDIKKANTLTAPLSNKTKKNSAEIRKNINFIVTNVPYGKGDFAYTGVNSSFEYLKNNKIKRLELNFVLKIIDILKDGGRASIIVPEGLLEAPTLSSFREYLLERCKIETIISLPKAAFAPYTKWKTYVIFIKKRNTPLKSIEEVIKKNEKIWAYIVDNDGYANSDKRFRTGLVDENGKYLHDELSSYVDGNGVTQSSIIEQHFEAKDEDIIKVWYDEWNNPIYGKKYGFITIQDIIKNHTVSYNTISNTVLGNILKTEADNRSLLSKEEHDLLISKMELGKKGYKKASKKDFFDSEGNFFEDFESIFETLGIRYNVDDNKLYDIKSEHIVYSLPLVPEKYFRNDLEETISFDDLQAKVVELTNMVNRLFNGDVFNEN